MNIIILDYSSGKVIIDKVPEGNEPEQYLAEKYHSNINWMELSTQDNRAMQEKLITAQGFYLITRLSKEDLERVLEKHLHPLIEIIPDQTMQRIADKLGDFFTENGYWERLEALANEIILQCPECKYGKLEECPAIFDEVMLACNHCGHDVMVKMPATDQD